MVVIGATARRLTTARRPSVAGAKSGCMAGLIGAGVRAGRRWTDDAADDALAAPFAERARSRTEALCSAEALWSDAEGFLGQSEGFPGRSGGALLRSGGISGRSGGIWGWSGGICKAAES